MDLYGAGLENRAAVERILGDGVIVTDSAEAIARQVRRVLEAEGLPAASGSAGRIRYGSTHPDPPAARTRIEALAGPRPPRRVPRTRAHRRDRLAQAAGAADREDL